MEPVTIPAERSKSHGTIFLLALTLLTSALAAYMAQSGRASWLEAASFVTGAVCVWLTVRENIWNFPIGLLNVITFSVVFFRAGLFADAGLQVVYFTLGCIGWYMWLFGGARHTKLKIARASQTEISIIAVFVVGMTLGLWKLLSHVGGSASFWDALTTTLSLASQWLLNRKRLESWIGWIVVDVIYVPLYLYKSLYLTAVLYAVFLCMAVIGLRQWHASWRQQTRDNSLNEERAPAGVA
jgi:nicotinamide mononucleotide transporter